MFITVAATEPTKDGLGRQANIVIKQMSRMMYNLESSTASHTVLNVGKGDQFSNGSVGLPLGQFLTNVGGKIQHAVGFLQGWGGAVWS